MVGRARWTAASTGRGRNRRRPAPPLRGRGGSRSARRRRPPATRHRAVSDGPQPSSAPFHRPTTDSWTHRCDKAERRARPSATPAPSRPGRDPKARSPCGRRRRARSLPRSLSGFCLILDPRPARFLRDRDSLNERITYIIYIYMGGEGALGCHASFVRDVQATVLAHLALRLGGEGSRHRWQPAGGGGAVGVGEDRVVALEDGERRCIDRKSCIRTNAQYFMYRCVYISNIDISAYIFKYRYIGIFQI